MNCCYVIFSKNLDRFYTGICHDNLTDRILKHNLHSYGEHRYSSKSSDWVLFLEIPCDSISQARRIELHIKRMRSRIYIENLLKYPEIIEKLKQKYKSS